MEGGCKRVIETQEMTCVSSINSPRRPSSINQQDLTKEKSPLNLYFPPLRMIMALASLAVSSWQHGAGNAHRGFRSERNEARKQNALSQ